MHKWSILILLVISTACQNVNFAPFYESKNKESVSATRALGPFYERIQKGVDYERHAFRPIWSYEKVGDKVAEDFFWPLAMSRRHKDYYQSNFLLLFYNNADLKNPDSEYLLWAFPFWYQGRDRLQQDYFGLFPFWGEVRDAIGYDSLEFKFFPFYLRCVKGEQISQSYLWPFYATMTSPREESFRILPFYGSKVKKDSHKSHFVMWPFWHEGESLNPKKPGNWYLFFPFYGKYSYDDVQKTTVLWPFFSWSSSDNAQAKSAPWPFYATRETKDGLEEKFTAWPFYSRYKAPNKLTKQYLWPIGTYSHFGDEKTYDENHWWLPFYWSSKKVKEGKTLEDYQRFWPLASFSQQGSQKSLNILSLWPQKTVPTIERNWQAIWELYRYYQNETITSHDFLWGLSQYRSDKKVDSSKFSIFPFYEQTRQQKDTSWAILKGLIGHQKINEKEEQYQLLWFIKFKVDR